MSDDLDWDKFDELYNKSEQFIKDFKSLVRKYVPKYPTKQYDPGFELLSMMQDRVSVYNPYVWSNDNEGSDNEEHY